MCVTKISVEALKNGLQLLYVSWFSQSWDGRCPTYRCSVDQERNPSTRLESPERLIRLDDGL